MSFHMSWGISLAKKLVLTLLDDQVTSLQPSLIESGCTQGAKWWIPCENPSTARSQFVQNEAQNQR